MSAAYITKPPFCSFDPGFSHVFSGNVFDFWSDPRDCHVQPRSILLWLPGIGAGGVIPVFPEGPLFPDHDCVRVAGKPRLEIGC